jgi:hypothetical protein
MLSRRGILAAGGLAPLLAGRQRMTTPRRVRGLGMPVKLGQQDGPLTGLINPYLPGTGWVVQFTPTDLAVTETEFEAHQIALDGPIGSSAVVMLDGHEHSYVQTAWANTASDEPSMLIRYGQTVQFCWNVAFTSPPYDRTANIRPRVTLWLRRTAEGVYY